MLSVVSFLLITVAVTTVNSASLSSAPCIQTLSTAEVPSSVQSEIDDVAEYNPSVRSIGSVLSTIELSVPTLVVAESTLAYYVYDYASKVSEIESMYYYPSLYSENLISEIDSAYPNLVSAVSYIFSVEQSQSALADYQETLQSLELSYPSILTVLNEYTGYAYPTLYIASHVITEATLTDSSIFASVIAVSTAVSGTPTVAEAVSYLSSAMYTVPSTVVQEVLTIIESPSTVSEYVVSSLKSCYETVYSELRVVTAFTYEYPSLVTDLTGYLSAASEVANLGSAVSIVVSDQMSTLVYELSVLDGASSKASLIDDDLQIIGILTAEDLFLKHAESVIEKSFYFSPTVATNIVEDLLYPSLITDISIVHAEKESHESLVKAVHYIIDWESYYPSYASILESVESQLTSAFVQYRTLLTAFRDVQEVTAPSIASASAAFLSAAAAVADLPTLMSEVSYLDSVVTSLQCVQTVEEYYAANYPSLATYVWSVLEGDTVVPTSQAYSWQQLIAGYSTLLSADNSILAVQLSYPQLATIESSLIAAAITDSSIITENEVLEQLSQSVFGSWSELTEAEITSSSY